MRAAARALGGTNLVVFVGVAVAGCGSKDTAGAQRTGSAARPTGSEATGGATTGRATTDHATPGAEADRPAPGTGLVVLHPVGEFSGTYDRVFAKLSNQDEPTTIAFVRGCPTLACTDNVFEIESIALGCPRAYLVLATLSAAASEPGSRQSDLAFAGPAEKPVTATLEHVELEITALGPDGIAGIAHHRTTDSSVKGAFSAEICGRR